jgi:hypothetical protein
MRTNDCQTLALDLTRRFDPESTADGLARGVCRLLEALGYIPLFEVPLASGRRADVLGLAASGRFAIVEVKSSFADFRADQKWQDYLPHCDRFYFAVGSGFPLEVLPRDTGLIIADRFSAELIREAPLNEMSTSVRRRQAVRFGRVAANRLRFLFAETA